MSKMEILRGLITEKMKEILAAVETTVAGYDEEVLSLKRELETIKVEHRRDGHGDTDTTSRDEQMETENGDCSTSEKCKEKNGVEGLATMTSHEKSLLENEERDCTSADDVTLKKNTETTRNPTVKNNTASEVKEVEELEKNDSRKTVEVFRRIRRILNALTPQTFQQLMKQVTELSIDTEERLKGVIHLTYEKAVSEPDRAVVYANMCRCLMGLKVPATDEPGTTQNFRKLLLNRCQKEFEKEFGKTFGKVGEDKDADDSLQKQQKELEAASTPLTEEMKEVRDKARRRAHGNIKFISELFKLKMLSEAIIHVCIVTLLESKNDESLECLCWLLFTIGKDLDFEKDKPRMDQYFNQMDSIIKERKTSSRTRSMLQDVLDLRRNNWVLIQCDRPSENADQAHKEEHWEQMKFQQALTLKTEARGSGGRIRGGRGGRGGGSPGRWCRPDTPGRGALSQDEGSNTVPISRNRPIDTSRLSRFTEPSVPTFNDQLLTPGKGVWGSWIKGSGMSTKPADTNSATSSAASLNSDRRAAQKLPEESLPKDVAISELVTEKTVEVTPGEGPARSKKSEMSFLELTNHLDRLIQDQTENQSIVNWIETNLDEKQTSSNMFVRALMTCVCRSVIIDCYPYRVNKDAFGERVTLLHKFLKDEQNELQALYALQALMVQMKHPPNLLRLFFDSLYDEDVIKEETFHKWEFSRDPAEQTGKGITLKSVTAFFTWLREAKEESDSC